ncbi:MAG: hypothetical protein ACOXZV_00520 [Bacteroidales bacterium]|jgi:hypothetical protein
MNRDKLRFENIRNAIWHASTVKDVIAEYCSNKPQRIRAEYIRQLTKWAHFLYKGNLQKTKDRFLRMLNVDEQNYYESMDK